LILYAIKLFSYPSADFVKSYEEERRYIFQFGDEAFYDLDSTWISVSYLKFRK
jgi:hypothetical protein